MIQLPSFVTKAATGHVPGSSSIPYGTILTDHVVKLSGGAGLLGTWRLDGIPFETVDEGDILARKEALHNFLRALGGGSFAVWTHKIRRVVHERLQGMAVNPFCRELSERYDATFATHRQMATELYLSILYRPPQQKVVNLFGRVGTKQFAELQRQEQEGLATFEDVAKQLEASLRRYEPERLGTFEHRGVVYSQHLSFLAYLINGVWESIPLRRCPLNSYLLSSRLHFSDRTGMVEIWHPSGIRKFAGLLDIQEYPGFSEPGMTNGMLYGESEYIETQSFSFVGKRDGLKYLERQRNHLIAGEDVATREIEQFSQAAEDLQSGLIDLGEYHYSIALFGSSLEEVTKARALARATFQDGPGFKMAVVDVIPECAWFAQLPGNWWVRPREATLTTRNFVCLSPFHNFARGKLNGNPWGEALALFQTPSGQPYYFNFHSSPTDRDSRDEKYPGNTFICGATGSGKTALELFLLAQAMKYQKFRGIMFDKDRGAEIGIRAMGGKYIALRRGEPTGFNPFQAPITEGNLQFCERLVAQLVKNPGDPEPRLSAKEWIDLSHAVRTVMSPTVRPDVRGLTTVSQNLPATGENSLKARLLKWTWGQPLGWVFDNPRDTQEFSHHSLFGYDYTEFLDDADLRTPVIAYLLHLTEQLITGDPFIFFMEEFWKPLRDPMFTEFSLNKLKTIRKQSGLGVFVTQSPSDVVDHEISKTIVEQCVTQIYLPNPRADHDDYVEGFKVTESEFRIIRNLGEASRKFLVKQGHQSAIVSFDLGGMSDLLNVISGTTENVALLDRIREEVGDDPAAWLPIFHGRIAARKGLIGTVHEEVTR